MKWIVLLGLATGIAWGQCPTRLTPSVDNVPAAGNGGDGSIKDSFQVTSNCQWQSTSLVPWITISFGMSGRNNGSVGYTVAQNKTPASRTGGIQVGSLTFTVIQEGAQCPVTIGSTSAAVASGGGSGSFSVTTTCQWTPVANVDWIAVGGGGTGNGTVSYTVGQNPTNQRRTGTISVYDKVFTVNQEGAACSYAVDPSSDSVPASFSGTKSFTLRTLGTCSWIVQNPATWVAVGPMSGTGTTIISYRVDPSDFAEPRSAPIVIGGAVFTLVQQAANCNFALTPGSGTAPAEGGNGSVTVTTGCRFTPASLVEWIRIRQVSAGNRIDYTVDPNQNTEQRTGSIRIGPSTLFTITQNARICSVQIEPESATITSAAQSGTIRVTSATACWTAESFAPWLTVSTALAGSNGTVTYTATANQAGPARAGAVRIGPKSFDLIQSGLSVFFTEQSVAHGASARSGPIAPGEIVVIYGTGMGPRDLVTAQLTSDGTALTTELAGTKVRFDGLAAPMIYTSEGQISAIVPYGTAGRTSVEAVIEYNGQRSAPVTLPVTFVTPGIFTANKSGTGQGAILNQDNSYNAEIPAAPGSIIQIFGTGEGVTIPLPSDGQVILKPPYPEPRFPVTVFIDGVQADVTYYGAAPTLVAGVLQVNARVPAAARSGSLPLQLKIGDALSRDGVTVSVR